MKKRLLSCLALLLLIATLLCSCAEGLPLSELYFAAADAAESYTAQLKLLQEGAKVIAANGESEYVIECTTTFVEIGNRQNPVKNAVNALAARIEAQTGADLLDTKREGATKRILIGAPAFDEVPIVDSATQFYIGFSGDDLIIQASNTIMLVTAINYFADTYLGEQDALILSPDLSYLSPTTTYHSREHNLIRAEQTGTVATQAATTLCDTLFEVAGVRFSVKSDFSSSSGVTNILFGYPDNPKAEKILANLSCDDFYIGVQEGQLMILARNDPALEKATRYFLAAFVRAEDAVFDKEEKTITLPAICDYYHRSDALLLTEDGINHAVLVYEAGVSSDVKNAIKNLADLYKRYTNTELPVYADTEYAYDGSTVEILVGQTNRILPQQTYLETLQAGRWMISADAEANLAVFAKDELALLVALKQLEKEFTAQIRAISKRQEDAEGWLQHNTNRTLYISGDFYLSGAEPPDLPVPSKHYFYTSYYRIVTTAPLSGNAWRSYQWKLHQAGFTRQSGNEEDGIVTCVYQNSSRVVTITYNKNNQSLEMRVTQHSRSELEE